MVPRRLVFTFQGGFVGTNCALEVARSVEEGKRLTWRQWTKVFPEDVNRKQSFDLPAEEVQDGVEGLRMVFEESSDFFGRITIYDLQVLGNKLS